MMWTVNTCPKCGTTTENFGAGTKFNTCKQTKNLCDDCRPVKRPRPISNHTMRKAEALTAWMLEGI